MIRVKATFASGAIRSAKAKTIEAALKKLAKYAGSHGEIVSIATA
jgi:hypothetical protein